MTTSTFSLATDLSPSVAATFSLSDLEQFYIGKILAKEGLVGYEPEVFAVLLALIDEGSFTTFLDVGANLGIFSIAAKALFSERVEVHAFEPVPQLANYIDHQAVRNGLSIQVHPVALGDTEGEATLYLSSQSDSSNSLNRRFRPHKGEIEVPLNTIDTMFPSLGSGHCVIKIDTESTEPSVLAGARALVKRERPTIVCEVLAGRTEDALETYFRELEYRAVQLTLNPSWEDSAKVVGDRNYRFRDWLFLPSPPSAAVKTRFKHWLKVVTQATVETV